MNPVNTLNTITRSLKENQRYQAVLLNDLQRQIDELRSELTTKVSFTIGSTQTYSTLVRFDTSQYEE